MWFLFAKLFLISIDEAEDLEDKLESHPDIKCIGIWSTNDIFLEKYIDNKEDNFSDIIDIDQNDDDF